MSVLLGTAALAAGMSAAQVLIEGIAGNEAHECFRPFRERIVERLTDGKLELPENHDLRDALEDSLRDALLYLGFCLAVQHAAKKPVAEKVVLAWKNGKLFSQSVVETLGDKDRGWLREFERAVRKQGALGSLQLDLQNVSVAQSAAAWLDAKNLPQLKVQLHLQTADWLDRKLQRHDSAPIASVCQRWIAEGWSPDTDFPGRTITVFDATSLFFQERLKSNPRVAEIYKDTLLVGTFAQVNVLSDAIVSLTPESIGAVIEDKLIADRTLWLEHFGEQRATVLQMQADLSRQGSQMSAIYLLLSTAIGEVQDAIAANGAHLQETFHALVDQGAEIKADTTAILSDTFSIKAQLDGLYSSLRAPYDTITTHAIRPLLQAKRSYCFGRDNVVERLVQWLLSKESGGACILGPAGVGKSTICLEALWSDEVASRFGKERLFVRCDAATDARSLWVEIARSLALQPGNEPAEVVIGWLQNHPTVIVLDNAETALNESERSDVESALAHMISLPECRLIVSLRGLTATQQCKWRLSETISPFDLKAARATFLQASAGKFESEPALDIFLVNHLACLPLAVFLLGCAVADYDSFEDVERTWQNKRTGMLVRPGKLDRSTSLGASYELSLNSSRMTQLSYQILLTLAWLPDGVDGKDVNSIWGYAAADAIAILRSLGLVYADGMRKQMLAPLREYLQDKELPASRVFS